MLRSLINQHLGRYLIVELLGRGGMAAVYRARDTALQRDVAIKVLYPQYCDDQILVERFKREAVTAAGLEHPNIVPIYDVGEHDGMVYIAMKLLNGRSLADLLNERSTLNPDELLAVLGPVASALDYAHARNIVHRDIKPGNVMLDGSGATSQPLHLPSAGVMLADFGIAKTLDTPGLTTTGALIGTPDYMAPEQIGNQRVDGRTDVYALGMLAFRALTGRQAFEGNTQDVLMAHLHQGVPTPSSLNPQITPAIDATLLQALARDPDQRFPTAGAFVQALRQAAGARSGDRSLPNGGVYAAPPGSTTDNTVQIDSWRAEPTGVAPRPAPIAAPRSAAPWQAWNWTPLVVSVILVVLMGGLTSVLVASFRGHTPAPPPTNTAAAGGIVLPAQTTTLPATTPTPSPSLTATVAATATTQLEPTSAPTIPPTVVTAPPIVVTAPPIVITRPPAPAPVTPTPAVPTPPPAVPTSTSTAVLPTATLTLTPCAIQPVRGFGKIFTENSAVRAKLGCPVDNEVLSEGAIQWFEFGTMIWYPQTDFHYVLFGANNGESLVFNRTEVNRYPTLTPTPEGATGDPRAPGGGFGQIYNNNPDIQKRLGKPVGTPRGMPAAENKNGAYQFFERGAMLFTPEYRNDGKTIFVVYNNDTFERYKDEFPE